MSRFTTVQEAIARELRRAIVTGEMKPGQRLLPDVIAGDFGVSRMPVREALLRLETEGLVTSYPYRGFKVSELSIEEIEEVFFLRVVIEPIAAGLGAPKLDEETFGRVEQMVAEMERSESDASVWIGLDRHYHLEIYRAAGSERLFRIVVDLRDDIERYIRTYIRKPGLIEASRPKHRDILEACRKRNADMAEQATRQHLRVTADIFVSHLKTVMNHAHARQRTRQRVPVGDWRHE